MLCIKSPPDLVGKNKILLNECILLVSIREKIKNKLTTIINTVLIAS